MAKNKESSASNKNEKKPKSGSGINSVSNKRTRTKSVFQRVKALERHSGMTKSEFRRIVAEGRESLKDLGYLTSERTQREALACKGISFNVR